MVICWENGLQRVKEKYEEHFAWLKNQDPLTRATKGFESALEWMFATDNQKHLDLFFAKELTYSIEKIFNI